MLFNYASKHVSFRAVLVVMVFSVILYDIFYHFSSNTALPIDFKPLNTRIHGTVDGLPFQGENNVRFKLSLTDQPIPNFTLKAVNVTLYNEKNLIIKPGDRLSLDVNLKAIKPYFNPGYFNSRSWSQSQGIGARASVVDTETIQQNRSNVLTISLIRWKLRQHLKYHFGGFEHWALMDALVFGVKTDMSQDVKDLLVRSGTAHLFVVSGLHIGLMYGVGLFFAKIVLIPLFWTRFSIQYSRFCLLSGLLVAFIYAGLAGFGVSTQRALFMLFVGICCWRSWGMPRPLALCCLAALGIGGFSPGSLSGAAFWLSFSSVIILIFHFAHRLKSPSYFFALVQSQWVIFIGLLPILYMLLLPVSPMNMVVNFFCVPIVGLLLIPLIFIAAILSSISVQFAYSLLNVADSLLEYLLTIMKMVVEMGFFIQFPAYSNLAFICLLLFAIFMLLPLGLSRKSVALFFLLPFLFPKKTQPAHGEVFVTALDVGQGLAIHLQTQHSNLLFDVGPIYPSGFNTGKAVLVPYLLYNGIRNLDSVIISHGDADHIGGLNSLKDHILIETLITNVNIETNLSIEPCVMGRNWWLDGVLFEILYPVEADYIEDSNNTSCVLKVTASNGRFLLPGDIERGAEEQLFSLFSFDKLHSDVLILPHHGSKTSSSSGFIHRVKPKYGVVSAGLWNRFQHPNKEVIDRYERRGVEILNTSQSGAISFEGLESDQTLKPKIFR